MSIRLSHNSDLKRRMSVTHRYESISNNELETTRSNIFNEEQYV